MLDKLGLKISTIEDFSRDKYERRRYVNSKKTDPMTLIIRGNDCEEEEEASKEESEEDAYMKYSLLTIFRSDSPKEKTVAHHLKAGKSFLRTKNEAVEKPIQKTNTDNGCLIDFSNGGDNDIGNQTGNCFNTCSEPVVSDKQYEFWFMNNKKEKVKENTEASNNLNDFNTFAPSKNTQLQTLTDNLLKVYSSSKSAEKPLINVVSMNNPNISIQNTYCNCKGALNVGYLYIPMQHNFNNTNPNLNPLMNLDQRFTNQPLILPKPASAFSSTVTPPIQNFNVNVENKKKTEDDPFKSLVSFK